MAMNVAQVLHEHEAGLAKCAGGRGKHAVLKLVGHLAKLHDGDEGGEGGAHGGAGGVSLPGVHTQHAQHRVLHPNGPIFHISYIILGIRNYITDFQSAYGLFHQNFGVDRESYAYWWEE